MTISERSLGTQPTVGGEKTFGANLQTVSESLASEITGLAVKTLQQRRWLGKPPTYLKVALPGFPWVADLLMSFPEGTNEGYGPIFSDSRADRALVC